MDGQSHPARQRGVGVVEHVVPPLVARTVAVGGEIEHDLAAVSERVVRLLDQAQRRIDRIACQPGDQVESILLAGELLHHAVRAGAIGMRHPPVGVDGTVVLPVDEPDLRIE